MPQQDKIKREIDRIGLVLAKLLSMLLQKPFNHSDPYGYSAQQLRSELDIDLDAFLEMGKGADLNFLVNDKKFTIEHLRNFGNMLYELAQKAVEEKTKKSLLDKAHQVYEYINTNGNGTLFLDVEYRLKNF